MAAKQSSNWFIGINAVKKNVFVLVLVPVAKARICGAVEEDEGDIFLSREERSYHECWTISWGPQPETVLWVAGKEWDMKADNLNEHAAAENTSWFDPLNLEDLVMMQEEKGCGAETMKNEMVAPHNLWTGLAKAMLRRLILHQALGQRIQMTHGRVLLITQHQYKLLSSIWVREDWTGVGWRFPRTRMHRQDCTSDFWRPAGHYAGWQQTSCTWRQSQQARSSDKGCWICEMFTWTNADSLERRDKMKYSCCSSPNLHTWNGLKSLVRHDWDPQTGESGDFNSEAIKNGVRVQ